MTAAAANYRWYLNGLAKVERKNAAPLLAGTQKHFAKRRFRMSSQRGGMLRDTARDSFERVRKSSTAHAYVIRIRHSLAG